MLLTFMSIKQMKLLPRKEPGIKFFRGEGDRCRKTECTYQRRSCTWKRFGRLCASLACNVRMTIIISFEIGNRLKSPTHHFSMIYGLFESFEFVSGLKATFYYFTQFSILFMFWIKNPLGFICLCI